MFVNRVHITLNFTLVFYLSCNLFVTLIVYSYYLGFLINLNMNTQLHIKVSGGCRIYIFIISYAVTHILFTSTKMHRYF